MSDELEILEGAGYLEARVQGAYSFEGFMGRMVSLEKLTIEKKFSRLLLDVRGLGGPMPSTMDRYELGKLGGEMSLDLRVAALVTPEQAQDPFASKVARNRGVRLEVFTDREKALAWLLREPGGS